MRTRARISRRRAAVLLIVLVLIPILALAGYAFNHAMRAESAGAVAGHLQAQARLAAESGIYLVQSVLSDPNAFKAESAVELYDNADLFAHLPATGSDAQRPASFSIVSPDELSAGAIRYGLVSECAKIPLNNGKVKITREALMNLPNMTDEVADSLMDWIDADDTPGANGGESSYYSALSVPYQPRNGPPLCIDELLQVKGVTPSLWYGNDANLDGMLGTNENDGEDSWPTDSQSGALDRGWRQYFTIHSQADNRKADGTKKTNVNGDATATAAALTSAFDQQIAAYYAVYKQARMNLTAVTDLVESEVEIDQNQLQTAFTSAGLDPQAAAQSLGVALPRNNNPGGQNQNPQMVTVASPWKVDAAGDKLDKLLQEFATEDTATVKGVIDVQRAPAVVLTALPGITAEIADKIASSAAQKTGVLTSTAWVLREKLVTVEQFRAIEAQITVAPRSFRLESVGFFGANGPVGRVEAVIVVGESTPQVVERRDLTPLGNGYSQEMLRNAGTQP